MRLGEEALAHAILGVVRQLAGRLAFQIVPEILQGETVTSLRQVLHRLIVELARIGCSGRRRRLGLSGAHLLETSHGFVELPFQSAHLFVQILGGAARGGARAEQDVALLRDLAPRVLHQLQGGGIAHHQGIDHRAQTIEPAAQREHLRGIAAGGAHEQQDHRERRRRTLQPRVAFSRCRRKAQAGRHGGARLGVGTWGHRVTMWARRFFAQAASSWPGSNGRSLPYDTVWRREPSMPPLVR